ncbi:YbaB/EbfC family nucleoid-associated protein [Actinoplanes sp. CA-030573]|uniref:YbaB/EbfC family nucleoid-associated protein n=1 Tax=Actinoplanes sp. CA-030573 TaxID=3239898 RepID=UPI003D94DB65
MDLDAELEQALADLERNQERIERIQAELNALTLKGSADRGAVTVTVTGDGRFTAVDLHPSVFREHDAYSLGDTVLAAINDAMAQLAAETRQRFGDDFDLDEQRHHHDDDRPEPAW